MTIKASTKGTENKLRLHFPGPHGAWLWLKELD